MLSYAVLIAPSGKKTAPKATVQEKIDFNRDIRPILSNKCLNCHGQDPKAVQAGLRLNLRESAVSKLASGRFAIVPGHPEKSELMERIMSKDQDIKMPPPDSNKVLSQEDIETLSRWIKEGAEYKAHWAFVPPVRPALPAVHQQNWVRNAIDRFTLARMEQHGLRPSPEADKATLLRRASLDLTGIPPTPAELNAFLADKSPKAYENQVDRLLASPRFAERMSMDWMDYSRYADSNGYQSDWERYQWRWRDWVINAFNQNMPYDQFIIKQLAGDLLPNPTLDDQIATGFNRNHRINTEGGVIAEEWRTENVIDRVETTSTVFLGLTAGCARCHDHKYDPITQKDFYSLYAYFNSVPESGTGEERPVNHPPFIKAPTQDQQAQYATLQTEVKTTGDKLLAMQKAHEAEAQNWAIPPAEADTKLKDAITARYQLDSSAKVTMGDAPAPTMVGKPTFDPGRDTGAVATNAGSYMDLGTAGQFMADKPFSYSLWVNPATQAGSPVSRMDSANNYRGWDLYMQGGHPACHVISSWPENALKVTSEAMLPTNKWSHVTVTYDGTRKAAGLHIYVDGKPTKVGVEADHLTGPIDTKVTAKIGTRTGSDAFMGKVDDFTLYSRALTDPEVAALADVDPARPLLAIPVDKRTEAEKLAISASWSKANDPAYAAMDKEHAKDEAGFNTLDAQVVTVMVMQDMAKPRQAHVLIRGQYDHPGDPVFPRTPLALPQPPAGTPKNRLGLAEWIASPNNPLTARVAVNRYWERCFGIGLVSTSEDFGTRADFPTHPELLDWLATEFVRTGWNVKAIFKEIAMSATYRQTSNANKEDLEKDPTNKWLARGARFRLPAEIIRDQAIYAAGMMTEKLGGPSVRPYQPDGIWDDVSVYGNLHNYKHDVGPNLHRRSLYTFWKRTGAPPEMTLFDVPGREICTVRRARTDTPLQALALLNDETFIEASRAIAQRSIKEGGTTPTSRIDFMFRTLMCRPPTKQETRILLDGFWERLSHYQQEPKEADKLIKIGDWPITPNLDPAGLAAYTTVASTLLNVDETITRD